MLNPVSASQTRSVLSSEPDTIFFPSGEKATDQTHFVWPSNGPWMLNPVSASQTRSVLSYATHIRSFPSGEKATDLTESVWPSNGPRMLDPVSASQTRSVLSFEPDNDGSILGRLERRRQFE